MDVDRLVVVWQMWNRGRWWLHRWELEIHKGISFLFTQSLMTCWLIIIIYQFKYYKLSDHAFTTTINTKDINTNQLT